MALFLFCRSFASDGTRRERHGKAAIHSLFLAFPHAMGYHAPSPTAPPVPICFGSMTTPQNPTRIYIDADACPVKEEIYRVAARHGLSVSVVAGQFIRVPQDPLIERISAGSA